MRANTQSLVNTLSYAGYGGPSDLDIADMIPS